MVKRKCAKCGMVWFSSIEEEEYWICDKCGERIPKSAEVYAN